MTDKDPKDMTVSELLRKAAIRETDEYGNITPHVKMFSALAGEDAAMTDYVDRGGLMRQLADKIDAELAQATTYGISEGFNSSLRAGAELWAKANGWPDFREGEDFGAWLDRCALKLPCDKDGEPWNIGDRVIPGNRCESKVTGFAFDGDGWFLKYRWCGIDSYANEFATSCKRPAPAPEVLGADLLPIKVGETVYRTDAPITEAVVTGFRGYDDGSIDVVCSEKGGKVTAFYDPSLLTHTPPDTQDRIDEDVAKGTFKYWGCSNTLCCNCSALVGGKKPWERLGTEDCHKAMVSDLLRRQRELDKRTGGEQ